MNANHKTRTYRIWQGMKQRCFNNNNLFYGGRGISVCERWKVFDNFLADMGLCPDGLTSERIDNNGNYEPDNCKWATYTEQLNNRRNNVVLHYKGKSQTISQWAKELNIKESSVRHRIRKGMTHKESLDEHFFDTSHYIVDKSKYSYYKQPTLLQRLTIT